MKIDKTWYQEWGLPIDGLEHVVLLEDCGSVWKCELERPLNCWEIVVLKEIWAVETVLMRF